MFWHFQNVLTLRGFKSDSIEHAQNIIFEWFRNFTTQYERELIDELWNIFENCICS